MALVTGDDGEPITVTVPVGAEQVVAQVWRVDVGRVPLFLLDADRPENGAVARWISSRLYTGDARPAPRPVPAARRRRHAGAEGDGDRPVGRPPQRGPRRLRLAGAGARRAGRGRLARRRAGRGPRAHGLHHAHAGAGRQRHLRARAGRASRWARWPTRSASTSTRSSAWAAPTPTTTASRSASPSSPCTRAARATASAAATARSRARCGPRCGPIAPSTTCRSATSPTACTCPTWVGDPMRALLDRHLGEGWMDRAADPATWDGLDDVDDADLWAARREQRAALVTWARERSMVDRLGRDEPREYVEAPRLRPRRAHHRLRPAPGHLQAPARAAAERRGDRRPALGRAQDPDPHGRQGAPARRRRQAQPAGAVRGQGHPRDRLPRRLPRRLRPHASASAPRARAATCGSTSRARRSRPAARAG